MRVIPFISFTEWREKKFDQFLDDWQPVTIGRGFDVRVLGFIPKIIGM